VVEALRDALAQVKELSRQIPELQAVRVAVETERDALRTELSDAQDALRDALGRLDAANNTITQLRAELERRLREKDDEIDAIRSVGLHRNTAAARPGDRSVVSLAVCITPANYTRCLPLVLAVSVGYTNQLPDVFHRYVCDKKLLYRRGTTQHAASVKMLHKCSPNCI